MNRFVRNIAFISLVAAVATQAVAADPGTRWRVTTSLSGTDINLPSRVVETCAVGDHQSQPPPTAQKDCKFTELSRDGNTVRYSVHCSTMDGTGQGRRQGLYKGQSRKCAEGTLQPLIPLVRLRLSARMPELAGLPIRAGR